MDPDHSAAIAYIALKPLFLGRIGEVSSRTKEENHVVFPDRFRPEVIQLVADDKVESALPGEKSGQEFLVALRVMPVPSGS